MEDTGYSILTLYGVAGTIGFLMTPFISYSYINGDASSGLTYGNQTPIRYQLACVLVLWTVLPIAILMVAIVTDFLLPLSKAEQPNGEYTPLALGPCRADKKLEYVPPPRKDIDFEGGGKSNSELD